MARYEHLQLYKEVYDYVVYFYKLSKGFSKDIKYGLATDLNKNNICLLEKIIVANKEQNKTSRLEEAEILVEIIKIKQRILKDIGSINLKSYEYIFSKLIVISKQIVSWKNWSEKGRSKNL